MIKFTVPGEPVAKKRHRTFITKGGSQRQYTPPETVLYENMVAICCREAMNEQAQPICTRAVKLAVRFYFPVPPSRARRLGEGDRHTQRPDLDNCIKSIKDGINGVGWHDDCVVVELYAAKYWTHQQSRAEIELEEL